jgi:hypothetical protein
MKNHNNVYDKKSYIMIHNHTIKGEGIQSRLELNILNIFYVFIIYNILWI